MTAPTNTLTSVTPQVGAREDLENDIYRVAPEETPFISMIGSSKATAINHEWQTETVDAADATNAQLEGDDVSTLDAANVPTRLGNYAQIFRKSGGVSGTQEAVDLAGRASELARQKVLKTIAIKRDAEKRFIGNFASNAESGGTPRRAGGVLAFLTTAVSRGSGGSSGSVSGSTVTAATNGTQRTFTESLVKAVRVSSFNASGSLRGQNVAFMGGSHKQQFSGFTGIADIRSEVKGDNQATVYAGADVYVDDFGSISLVPHAYGLTRDCLFLNPKMAAVGTLRGLSSKALASSGDNEKFLLLMERTLVVKNEKAHAVVADLT
jgi:hypothetical protein